MEDRGQMTRTREDEGMEERGLGQVETSGGGHRTRTGGDEGMEDR